MEQFPVTGDPIGDTEPSSGLSLQPSQQMLPPGGTETDLGACCCFEPLLNCFDGIIDDGKAHDLDILPPIKEYLFN